MSGMGRFGPELTEKHKDVLFACHNCKTFEELKEELGIDTRRLFLILKDLRGMGLVYMKKDKYCMAGAI